jgi:hypothetical protein
MCWNLSIDRELLTDHYMLKNKDPEYKGRVLVVVSELHVQTCRHHDTSRIWR